MNVDIDHTMISEIMAITSGEEFKGIFAKFEEDIEAATAPLKAMLNKVLLSSDISRIEQHATYVEHFRSRLVRYHSLCTAFVEHGKSSHFLLAKLQEGIKMNESDREAHRKTMTCGYMALQSQLEGLIRSIDSRVNIAKKLFQSETDGFRGFGGTIQGERSRNY